MAKFETKIRGSFSDFVDYLKKEILSGSLSASLEEESVFRISGAEVAVLAFERYSHFGGNRVGMTVTVAGKDGELIVVGMSTGGSKAVFFKINTIGEEAFLDKLREAVARFLKKTAY